MNDSKKLLLYCLRSLGLFASILMFAVYNQASMRRLSVSIYIRCLAFVCACKMLYHMIVIEHFYKQLTRSDVSEKMITYFTILFVPIMVWFQVMASFDRFLVILFPTKLLFVHRQFTQRICVATVIVYNMLFYSCTLLKYRTIRLESDSQRRQDAIKQARLVKTLSIFDLANSLLAPVSIMCILSIGIVMGILKAYRQIESSSGSSPTLTRKTLKDIKFGVTVIVLNVSFFLFFGIWRAYSVLDQSVFAFLTDHQDSYSIRLLGLILKSLGEFYFSTIFFVQLAVNGLVRRELWQVFTLVWRTLRDKLNYMLNPVSSSSSIQTSQELPLQTF